MLFQAFFLFCVALFFFRFTSEAAERLLPKVSWIVRIGGGRIRLRYCNTDRFAERLRGVKTLCDPKTTVRVRTAFHVFDGRALNFLDLVVRDQATGVDVGAL